MDPKQVVVRNTEKDSVFFIRAAQRKDSGKYQIHVKILDEFEDVATFDLLVIGKDNKLYELINFLILKWYRCFFIEASFSKMGLPIV